MKDIWELFINIFCGLFLGAIIMLGSSLAIYGSTPFYRVMGCVTIIVIVVEIYSLIRG